MSLPYFPMFPTDFEADTSHLSLEEDGAYNRLLRIQWMTPGCTLPDDDTWLQRRMRCDLATYERVVRPVIDEFFSRRNGRIFSPRLLEEWKKVDETSRKRSRAGKKGGRPKAIEKQQKPEKAGFDFDKARPKQPEPYPYRDTLDADASNGASAVDATSEAIWKRGVPFLVERGTPEKQARSIIGKWLRDAGAPALFDAMVAAKKSGTGDPVPYITEALKAPPDVRAMVQDAVKRFVK